MERTRLLEAAAGRRPALPLTKSLSVFELSSWFGLAVLGADANHEPGSTGHWCCRAVASCFAAALARSASISPRPPTKLSNLLQAPARPPRIDGALPDALAHRTQHLLR